MTNMKSRIALIVVISLLVGVLATGVAVQYQTYQHKQTTAASEAATEAATRQAALDSQLAEIDRLRASEAALMAQCQEASQLYELLPLSTRAKTTQPTCHAAE